MKNPPVGWGGGGGRGEERNDILKIMSSILPCALHFLFFRRKIAWNFRWLRKTSVGHGKLRYLRQSIPGQYRAIIFPSPDRLVRRHPVRVAESCVRSCNSVEAYSVVVCMCHVGSIGSTGSSSYFAQSHDHIHEQFQELFYVLLFYNLTVSAKWTYTSTPKSHLIEA